MSNEGREQVSDIVERLRKRTVATLKDDWEKGKKCPECGYKRHGQSHCAIGAGGHCPAFDPSRYDLTEDDYTYTPEPLSHEAADRITALEAELAAADVTISRFNSGQELQDSLARENALAEALDAEKAKVAKLRKAMVEIRDRQARNILPWTHEQAADEYARMLDADRMTARRIHEETA
jgi:hypothetical protein